MTRVALPAARSTFGDTAAGFEIVIPARRHAFLVLFLGAWLVGWAFGEATAFWALLGGKGQAHPPPVVFLSVWLAAWTAGGAAALYTWAWMLAGKERVLLQPGTLSLKRDVFGLGRSREFDVPQIRNLRVSPQPAASGRGLVGPFGSGGALAFDYGAGTFRFGEGIDEAEAGQLIAELKRRQNFTEP